MKIMKLSVRAQLRHIVMLHVKCNCSLLNLHTLQIYLFKWWFVSWPLRTTLNTKHTQLPSLFFIFQATASTADTGLVCPQTSEDKSTRAHRCHCHPSIRWRTQTVFPQNPTARQWHSQPHFVRGIGPQWAPKGLWKSLEMLLFTFSDRDCFNLFVWSCRLIISFFLVLENSEHSGCWNDADGGNGCISCTCGSGEIYFTDSDAL